MNERIASFRPVANPDARILVLGSMPGEASLRASQYYAHPRNSFWRIMGEAIGLDSNGPYDERLAELKDAGIALWDVLHSCERKGSLDAAIEWDSIVVNDFDAFFRRHPNVDLVCFNGAVAERCYRKHVSSGGKGRTIQYVRLPSTSPAHAALSFKQKANIWRSAINPRQAMAPGYSGTPLAKKLGIGANARVFTRRAPENYRELLEPLPSGVSFDSRPGEATDVVHVFVDRKSTLSKDLAELRQRLRSNAIVWVSWPKKSSMVPTDITDGTIRDVALPLGFVDVKVCAVTDVWSGLKLCVRKELC